jgi:hypothetical protein
MANCAMQNRVNNPTKKKWKVSPRFSYPPIDQLVYELNGLMEEEIRVVEGVQK